jgi:hypothetical protein
MSGSNRPERLQVMLSPEEIRALDDWRFARRMPSRAAAIRDLLRRGLTVEGIELATPGRHSAAFGVLEEAAGEGNDNGSKERRSRIGNGPT